MITIYIYTHTWSELGVLLNADPQMFLQLLAVHQKLIIFKKNMEDSIEVQ